MVLVCLPEAADDIHIPLLVREEIIFLYINNSEDTHKLLQQQS